MATTTSGERPESLGVNPPHIVPIVLGQYVVDLPLGWGRNLLPPIYAVIELIANDGRSVDVDACKMCSDRWQSLRPPTAVEHCVVVWLV